MFLEIGWNWGIPQTSPLDSRFSLFHIFSTIGYFFGFQPSNSWFRKDLVHAVPPWHSADELWCRSCKSTCCWWRRDSVEYVTPPDIITGKSWGFLKWIMGVPRKTIVVSILSHDLILGHLHVLYIYISLSLDIHIYIYPLWLLVTSHYIPNTKKHIPPSNISTT